MSEFNIPSLKESLADFQKLHESVDKNAKSFLELAIAAEKAVKATKADGIKDYVETQKKAKDQIDKVQAAKDKLAKATSDEAKQLALINLQIQQQNADNKRRADVTAQLVASLQSEVKSVSDARAQNALLTQARNNLDITTQSGKETLKTYNDLLDKNNAFIKTNADALTQQKLNVGNYAEGMQTALEKAGLFNGKIGELSRTAIGFVQEGAKAVQKVKDINESVVTGAKAVGNYVSAKIGFIKTEQASTVAIEAETIATEESRVATIGFTQAERAQAVATETATISTEANTVAVEGMAVAEEGATAATGIFGVALGLLLSPITLIILAVAALAYIFKDFAPLINPIKDAFAQLGAVFSTIKQDIFDLVTGARSLTDIFSNLGSSLKGAAAEAKELAQAQRDLAKAQEINEVANAKAQTQVQDLILKSKNRTLSEKERIDLIKQAQKIEEEAFQKTNKLNDDAIVIARKKLFEGKTISEEERKFIEANDFAKIRSLKITKNLNADELKDYQDLLIKKEELAQRDNQIREKAQNRADQLADKQEADRQKAQEAADKAREKAQKDAEEAAKKELERQKKSLEITISTMKLTLDNQIATYDQSQHLDEENLAHVQTISDLKIAIANAELQKNLIGIQKGSLDEKALLETNKQDVIKIENEKSKAINDVKSNRAKFELELYDETHKSLIDGEKTLTDLLVDEEKRRMNESLAVHKEAMRQELAIDKDTTDEKLKLYAKTGAQLSQNELKYLKFITAEEEKLRKDTKKLDTDLLNSKLKANSEEEKDNDRKFKLEQKGVLATNLFELKEEEKRLKKDLQLQAGNAKEEEKINISLVENKQKQDKLVNDAKVAGLQASLSAFIEFAGKESAVGKVAAIAQATINTYEGATKALTEYPAPYSYIVAGLTIANGLNTVAKIEGVQMFAEGTLSAPYTGKAIVDEEGAEIHLSSSGQIKSMGSNKGARFTDIAKGDVIIPADVSAVIRQMTFASYGMKNETPIIDYNEIGAQFGKHASKIVGAIQNKKEPRMVVNVQRNINDRVSFKGARV